MGTRDCLSKRREDLRYLNLFAIHCYIDPEGQAMESACTLLLNLDSTFLGLFWIQPNLIIRGSCQNDYHALMDHVFALNKSIYTVNPSHFLVFWPFRSMEFKCYWNRSMGARDNKGGGGAKWAGGGSSKRNSRGRHRRGYTTLLDNCNGRKPRNTGRRTDTGGRRFGPPSSLPPPLPHRFDKVRGK